MKIDGEYIFDGPREQVWEVVRDPEVLAAALPGTQKLEQTGENEYEGVMNVRIGPVGGVFSGKVIISDEEPPESLTLTVEGRGNPGFVKGSGRVNLSDLADHKTMMKYNGDLQIGGRLASVGQRLLDTTSKSMIRQGLEALNDALQAREAARIEGGEVDYTPPSETKFMAAVTKDMLGQMFSSPTAKWIVIAVVLIVIVIAAVILTL